MIVKSPVAIECAHCKLPVPRGLIDESQNEQFCCGGCKAAFQLIHANGLDSFYVMAATHSEALSLKGRGTVAHRFAEFDSDSFLQKFANLISQNERQIKLTIDGMHCAACIWLIEKLPSIVSGVLEARVNWSKAQITLRWDPSLVELSVIAQKLHQLGYSPYPIRESDRQKRFQIENRRQLSRIGVAAALAGNNMILSAALYIGLFSGMSANITLLLRMASGIVGMLALLFPGRIFLVSALNAVRTRTPHMDLPIALALTVGTLAGLTNVIRGTGEIYFDSLAVLVFLLLIGRWLQFRQQSKAADSVEMLYQLTPRTTHKVENGRVVDTLVDLITVNDVLEIRAGEIVPADGQIVEGESFVDESVLTGESIPVRKMGLDSVSAGTTNRDAVFRMRIVATGDDTRLAKIVELVEQTANAKPQIVQWADKIGGYFVSAVILLATVTLLYWLPVSMEIAVERSIALLIVACPCALALATPLAISVALGYAARSGIMIKGGNVLQALQHTGTLWLDKTGTLTDGDIQVAKWYGCTQHLRMIAEIEYKSAHPAAKAIARFASQASLSDGIEYEDLINARVVVREFIGMGVQGRLGNHELLIGNEKLLEHFNIKIGLRQQKLAASIADQGYSPVWIASNGTVSALVALADSIREDAKNAIQQLESEGWEVGILSGDHQMIVDRVARRLGIASAKAIGQASPEDKLEIVLESANTGTVIMIGDGVNDSAALAAATVGMAVKNGAEASLAAAPVYLAKPGLNPVLHLFRLSNSTTRTMRTNLGVSLAYNILFAAAAFCGFVNPLVAAIIMPISSLTVVSLSMTAGRTKATPGYLK